MSGSAPPRLGFRLVGFAMRPMRDDRLLGWRRGLVYEFIAEVEQVIARRRFSDFTQPIDHFDVLAVGMLPERRRLRPVGRVDFP